MQNITLDAARDFGVIDELIIHSLDLSLYIAFIVINNHYYALQQNRGKTYKRHCIEHIKADFDGVTIKKIQLVHESAYDEMIGQPPKISSNALCVPQSKGGV